MLFRSRPAPGHEPHAGAGAAVTGGPLDPSGRLAEAVAELGRHLASVLEAERERAARLAREQHEARSRFELDRRLLEGAQSHPSQPVIGTPQGRGQRGRRKRAR